MKKTVRKTGRPCRRGMAPRLLSWLTAVAVVLVGLTAGNVGAAAAEPGTGAKVYVYNSTAKTLQVIDAATGVAGSPSAALSGTATSLFASPDGSRIYYSVGSTITALDVATNTTAATYTGITSPTTFAFSPDGSTLYAANSISSRRVYAVDLASGTVTLLASNVYTGGDLAVTPDGKTLIVASSSSTTPITLIDLATNAATVTDIAATRLLVLDSETALVNTSVNASGTLSTGVSPVDLTTMERGEAITTTSTTALSLAPGGGIAYAYAGTAKELIPIDTTTLTARAAIALGSTASAVTPGADTDTVYVAYSGSPGQVTPLNAATGVFGIATTVGNNPTRLAVARAATAPNAIREPSVKKGDAAARLRWSAPLNGGSPITGYVITPYVGGVAQTPVTVPATSTSHTVGGLTNGTTYTFTVAAVNAVGTGAESPASVSVTPEPLTAPDAPTGVAATAGDHEATVTWVAPEDDGGDDVTGYVITPYLDGAAQSTVTTSGAGTEHTVTGLTVGGSYTFTVAAQNTTGTGAASAASAAVVPWQQEVPSAPTNVVGASEDSAAVLTWTAPSSDGHSAITGYVVQAITGGGTVVQTIETTGTATTLTVTGLTNNMSYNFTVAAKNAIGTGPSTWAILSVIPYPDVIASLVTATDSPETWDGGYLQATIGADDNLTGTFMVSQADHAGGMVDPSRITTAVTSSSNPAVADVSDVTVTGRGNIRTVTVTPGGTPGRTTITLTLTGTYRSTTTVFTYAASGPANAESTPQNTKWFLASRTDASTIVDVGDGYAIVADDEDNVLRLVDTTRNGTPIRTWNTQEVVTAVSGKTKEADYESSVRVGDTIYWLASAGIGYKGPGVKASDADRQEVVATRISGSGAQTQLEVLGAVTGLADAITTWNENQGQPLGTLQGAPKAVATALNVEGAVLAPGSADAAYLAMRGPVVGDQAVILPMTNFTSWAAPAGSTSAAFGDPIFLDLDGSGIREITRDDSGRYLILAGAWADAGPQALYLWSGSPDEEAVKMEDLPDMDPTMMYAGWEGIYAPDGYVDGAPVGLIQDNGTTRIYGDNNDGNAGNDTGKQLPVALKKSLIQTFTLDLPDTTPEAPAEVSAVPGTRSAVVSWQPPVRDGDSAVTAYHLTPYRNGVAQASVTVDGSTTATSLELTPGVYTFTVSATNAIGDGPASGASEPVVVTKAASAVELTVTTGSNPARDVVLSAILSEDASGSVEFFDAATSLGTVAVVPGETPALTVARLENGSHPLKAVYSGDENYQGAFDKQLIVLAVGTQPTTMSLAVSATTVAPDQHVTVRVTLPQEATGSVTLLDSFEELAVKTVSPGTETTFDVVLAAGTHYLRAEYAGDADYAAQTAQQKVTSVKKQVDVGAPALTDANPVYGSAAANQVSVTVTGAETGTVRFASGSTLIGTAPIVEGTAAVTIPATLPAGTYADLRAAVEETDLTGAETSPAVVLVVRQATVTSIGASLKRSAGRRPVAQVRVGVLDNGAFPVGMVVIRVKGRVVGRVTLDASQQGRASVKLRIRKMPAKVKVTFVPDDASVAGLSAVARTARGRAG